MYSYENYPSSYPALPGGSWSGDYWGSSDFSYSPFSNQSDKPGFDWAGLMYGLGAATEGVGNLVSRMRGDDRPPQRFAGEALRRYLQKDQPDTLTSLLTEIISKRSGNLQKDPTKVDFSQIFAPFAPVTG